MAGQRMRDAKGHRFTRPQGSRRVWCEACRPPRVKSDRAAPPPPGEPGRILGELERTTLEELTARGREATIAGQAALYAARQLDSGGHSGSQTASLLRELRASAEAALAGAPVPDDALDEVGRRRAAKAAGA